MLPLLMPIQKKLKLNGPLHKLPVYEPGLSDVVKEARGRNLFFSDDIAGNIENPK